MNRAAPEVSPRDHQSKAESPTAEHVGLAVPDVALADAAPAPENSWPQLYGFRITDEIAAGGMAVIYRAVQESLHRPVAIKALRTDIVDETGELGRPNWRDRFKREARILALLKHPNLVQVHDLIAAPGLTLFDDGPLFIVMELCEGIDLLDVLTARPVLPPDVATIVALGAARALGYIHERQILHRDVKPANLLLSRRGEVKLIDFGTAWDPMNPRDLRGEERGLGTPSYMSPEQARGEPLDGRSDQFALGAVLYQMLAGRKPFVGRPGEAPQRLLEQVVRAEPPPLATQNRAVPRRLVRIVERCLKKRPSERFPTVDELSAELAKLIPVDAEQRLGQFLVDENLLKSSGRGATLSPTPKPAARTEGIVQLANHLKALLRL